MSAHEEMLGRMQGSFSRESQKSKTMHHLDAHPLYWKDSKAGVHVSVQQSTDPCMHADIYPMHIIRIILYIKLL